MTLTGSRTMHTLLLRILLIGLAGTAPCSSVSVSAQTKDPADSVRGRIVNADSTGSRVLLPERQRFGLAGPSGAGGPLLTLEAHYPPAPSVSVFLGPGAAPPSRVDRVFHGVGMGANTAGFLGAMGNALGLWEEHTAWALIAAGASIGAIWKGASSEPSP
jgi:hypothetical protein